MRTIYVAAVNEHGAHQLAEYYREFTTMRGLMEDQGYVSDSAHEAARNAGRITSTTPHLPAPVRVWAREIPEDHE